MNRNDDHESMLIVTGIFLCESDQSWSCCTHLYSASRVFLPWWMHLLRLMITCVSYWHGLVGSRPSKMCTRTSASSVEECGPNMYLLLYPLNSTMSFVLVNHRRGIDSPKYQQDLFNTRTFLISRQDLEIPNLTSPLERKSREILGPSVADPNCFTLLS